ncbi:dopamine D2-like receptor [Patiria miniata]|uniref:G-protein coupled receptors family 1 profile domain-containing protein n=1 Tax=Patiria miniata TaxID=46514 RepID=A0A913Z231_PATMI|nr:dopamine D2-like receptor [Patiria miniata]
MHNESTTTEGTCFGNCTVESDAGRVVYQSFIERQILAAIFITIAILGTVGNSFVILAVAWTKKLRTITNVFVVNLAVADVLTCVFMPWQVVAILGGNAWPIPGAPWVCAMAGFVVVVTFGCSINSLALIAVNRWVGITKSRVTTRRIYTARKLALMVIFSWAIPLGCALTPVLTDFGELGYEKLYATCTWDISNTYSAYYNILLTVVCYPIQTTVIIFSYMSIFCYVRRTTHRMVEVVVSSDSHEIGDERMRRNLWKRQLGVTKNLLYIILAFMVCLTPYFVAIVVYTDWSYRLTPWAGAILFCNSFVNPIIYATSHPDFKRVFSHVIRYRRIPRSGSFKRPISPTNTGSDA